MNIKYQNILTKEILETEIINLGYSPRKISEKLNIPLKTIYEYLGKFGLKQKTHAWRTFDEYFFSKETEETFYIAGFIAADGCVRNKNNTLEITLQKSDKYVLEYIKKAMSADNIIHDGFSSIKNKKYPNVRISFHSAKMVQDLAKFNIVQNKTLTYEMPEWLINHKFIHHFLRGYSDGDFCWRIDELQRGSAEPRLHVSFKMVGAEKCLQQALFIFKRDIDINISDTKVYHRKANGKFVNCFAVDFGGNMICDKIYRYLYKDAMMFMPRKRDIAIQAAEAAHHINRDEITKELIEEAYNRLGSQEAVGEELGYVDSRICQFMNEFGIPAKETKKSKITKELLEESYNRLRSMGKVAEELNYTDIYKLMQEYNISTLPRQHKYNEITKEMLEEAYGRLKSQPKVAEELGVRVERISMLMKKFNILTKFAINSKNINKEIIEEAYARLKTQEKVEKELGLSNIGLLMKQFGISTQPRNPHNFTKENLQEAYHRLDSCKKVAEEFSCSKGTIIAAIKRFGISKK